MAKTNDNLSIWEAWGKTPPEAQSDMSYGRKQTNVQPYWEIKKATEILGPIGINWGIVPESVKWEMIEAPFYRKKDKMLISDRTLIVSVVFFYKHNDQEGRYPIIVDAPYTPGDECFKKIMTNIISKALPSLGCAADIFMGQAAILEYSMDNRREDHYIPDPANKRQPRPERQDQRQNQRERPSNGANVPQQKTETSHGAVVLDPAEDGALEVLRATMRNSGVSERDFWYNITRFTDNEGKERFLESEEAALQWLQNCYKTNKPVGWIHRSVKNAKELYPDFFPNKRGF